MTEAGLGQGPALTSGTKDRSGATASTGQVDSKKPPAVTQPLPALTTAPSLITDPSHTSSSTFWPKFSLIPDKATQSSHDCLCS